MKKSPKDCQRHAAGDKLHVILLKGKLNFSTCMTDFSNEILLVTRDGILVATDGGLSSCKHRERGERSYNIICHQYWDTLLESYGPKSWKHLSDCSYDEQHPCNIPTVFIMHICTSNVY